MRKGVSFRRLTQNLGDPVGASSCVTPYLRGFRRRGGAGAGAGAGAGSSTTLVDARLEGRCYGCVLQRITSGNIFRL